MRFCFLILISLVYLNRVVAQWEWEWSAGLNIDQPIVRNTFFEPLAGFDKTIVLKPGLTLGISSVIAVNEDIDLRVGMEHSTIHTVYIVENLYFGTLNDNGSYRGGSDGPSELVDEQRRRLFAVYVGVQHGFNQDKWPFYVGVESALNYNYQKHRELYFDHKGVPDEILSTSADHLKTLFLSTGVYVGFTVLKQDGFRICMEPFARAGVNSIVYAENGTKSAFQLNYGVMFNFRILKSH
jgi:hypothetical protein